MCAGSFEALDRHAEATARYTAGFGVDTRASRYRYYWVNPEELNSGPCSEGEAPGCFSPNNDAVYASRFYPHEVVHAEFASGHSSFVDEGLATLLGGARFGNVEDDPSVQAVIDETAGSALPGDHYEIAAKFVRVLGEFRPDDYLQPLLETKRSDDFDAMDSRLDGFELQDAALVHEDAESCGFDAVRVALTECTIPPVEGMGSGWISEGTVDCSNPDAMGPDRDDQVWVVRPFEVETAGPYTVRFKGEATVRLVSCENSFCESGFSFNGLGFDNPRNGLFIFADAEYRVEFAAGRHWFHVSRGLEDERSGEFELSVVEGWPE